MCAFCQQVASRPKGQLYCSVSCAQKDRYRKQPRPKKYETKSEYDHAHHLKKKYGITPDQYAAILEKQEGRCFICLCKPKSKRLAVDHDHKTNKIRGLLCSRCNHKLLGSANDSIEMLQRAIDYLTNPPAKGVINIICGPCGKREHHFCDALLKSVPTLCDCQHRDDTFTQEEVLAA